MMLFVLLVGAEPITWAQIGVIIAALGLFTSAMLWRIGRHEDKSAKKLTELREKVDAAEADKHEIVDKLIDERLRRASHDAMNAVQSLVLNTDALKEELKSHLSDIKLLSDRDHKHEMGYVEQISDLKDWMRTNFASKQDVQVIDSHVRTLDQRVTALSERVNKQA